MRRVAFKDGRAVYRNPMRKPILNPGRLGLVPTPLNKHKPMLWHLRADAAMLHTRRFQRVLNVCDVRVPARLKAMEFRPPGVTRFQPLRGIARFYRFRRPFGFLWMGYRRKDFRFQPFLDID